MMLNRPAIFRLFASICLLLATSCPGWGADNIIRPLVGNEILGSRDVIGSATNGIIDPVPIFVYQPERSWISAHADGIKTTTYARTSSQTYVDADGVLRIAPANVPAIENGYVMLDGATTSYYWQPYTESGGAITAIAAPVTRTVTLPSKGDYVLWIDGNASLSVTVAANTAAGSGWGTLTESGSLKLSITTAGTVDVTVSGGAANDIVQLITGVVKTSYIPTPTSTPVARTTSASNTSGNGLQCDLTPDMIDCFGNGGSGTGTGTLIQWVNPSLDKSNSGDTGIATTDSTTYRLLIINWSNGFSLYDGINNALIKHVFVKNIPVAVIIQFSASTGKMRCGYYAPATKIITWSSATLAEGTTYRGYFPIHSSNKLRWFYGGTIPIGIGGCAIYDTILTDDEIIRAAQALQ